MMKLMSLRHFTSHEMRQNHQKEKIFVSVIPFNENKKEMEVSLKLPSTMVELIVDKTAKNRKG